MALANPQLSSAISNLMAMPGLTDQQKIQKAFDVSQNRGITPEQIAANSPFSVEQVNRQFSQFAPQSTMPVQGVPTQAQPSFGLQGAEEAAITGTGLAQTGLQQTQQQVSDIFNQGIQGLQPFSQAGQQAFDVQAALSGALGSEAQAQAFQDFQASPGQQFLQEQGERALTRNAAALGGLGGGNVRQELVRFGQGLASQDLQNQFSRLGRVAQPGLSAATTTAGLGGQLGGIQAGLGQFGAQLPFQTGRDISQMRFTTGRDIAGARGATTSALANLAQQQGAGLSDIVGTGTANVNQLFQMASQGDAGAREQLGTILANLSAQQGSQVGSLPIIPGATTNTLQNLAQLAGGIGGVISAFPQQQTSFSPMQGNVGVPINPVSMAGVA